MTTYAQGSRLQVAIGEETVIGTASTTLTIIPVAGENLAMTKDSFASPEIRSDRQTADFRHGAKQAGGDLPIAFKYGDFDTLLEGALFSDWVTASTSITSTSVSATNANQFVRAAGWTGFVANQYIDVSGFTAAANNGVFRIASASGTTLTLTYAATTTEVAGDSVTVALRDKLYNSTTIHGYTIECGYLDILKYLQYTGQRVNTWTLSVAPNGMVESSFGFIGELCTPSTTTLDASPASQSANNMFSGIDCATIYEGTTAIAIVTALDLTLSNNLSPVYVLGTSNVKTVAYGRCNVTGNITALFSDLTLMNKFVNETESALFFVLTDPDGNKMSFDLPRVKFGSGDPTPAGNEGIYTLSMSFTALRDSTTGYTLITTRAQTN